MKILVINEYRNCLIAWVILAIVLPHSSSAQVDWRESLEPLTSRAALTESLISLEIDNPEVVWTLYENMVLTIVKEAASFEAVMKKNAGDGGLMTWKRTKSWHDRRRELQHQFEDDVALTLDESQQAIWKSFTRLLRRQRLLPEMGQYVPQITLVDLLEVLDKLELSARERDDLKEVSKSYEESLDTLLVAWENQHGKLLTKMWELRPLIRAKDKKAKEADKRLREQFDKFILSIRDFNNSIDTEIASFLEPDHQQEFLMMVTIRDFPDLFIQSPVDISTKRLETYDGLTDEQRSVIRVLYSDYKVKRFTDRQQMIFDLRHWNSQKQTDRRFARLEKLMKDGLTRKEAVEVFAREHVSIPHLWRLHEHERQTCEAMRNVFSPEQFNKLPAEVRLYLSLWRQ